MERKVGECCQCKAIGQCSKGDSRSFSHGEASGNRRGHGQKTHSSSPAPQAKAQTDGKIPSKKFRQQRRELFWNKRKDSWVKVYVSVT